LAITKLDEWIGVIDDDDGGRSQIQTSNAFVKLNLTFDVFLTV